MTYALSAPLQAAVFARLSGDAGLAAIVGDAVFDAVPPGSVPSLYVAIGEETVRDRSDRDGGGARHDFTITVVSDRPGFAAAKDAAAAISDALLLSPLSLSRGRVVGLWFLRAQARRTGSDTQRRIDLRFRARTEDN